MDSIAEYKKELDALVHKKDDAERRICAAGIIAEALKELQLDPVLVGGTAVEFYTRGRYTTADIDLVSPGGNDLRQLMSQMGFIRMGKDFVDKKRRLYVEFPSEQLRRHEQTQLIDLGRRQLRIISVEDLIVDRLMAFKFWQSAIDGVNVMLLLEMQDVDQVRLAERAGQEDVSDALRLIREVQKQIVRKKLTKRDANLLLLETMRKMK